MHSPDHSTKGTPSALGPPSGQWPLTAGEDRVDALALKAEEGRGDRRNVPGELHASDEPGESEWGNPSRVMSGDRLLNT